MFFSFDQVVKWPLKMVKWASFIWPGGQVTKALIYKEKSVICPFSVIDTGVVKWERWENDRHGRRRRNWCQSKSDLCTYTQGIAWCNVRHWWPLWYFSQRIASLARLDVEDKQCNYVSALAYWKVCAGFWIVWEAETNRKQWINLHFALYLGIKAERRR